MVEALAISVRTVLAQVDDKDQIEKFSKNYRNKTQQEQEFAITYREITAIVYVLKRKELKVGSKPKITFLNDHNSFQKPFTRENNKNVLFCPTSNFFTRFSKILINRKKNEKHSSVDLSSRNFSDNFLKYQGKSLKTIPASLKFHAVSSKNLESVHQTFSLDKDK